MNPILFIYNEFLWRPLFNGLVWFYVALPPHDLGLAILALTVLIRIVLFPLLYRSQKAQKDMARIQPEIKKIQERLKGDREAQGKALMELYAAHKVNPLSGCLMVLLQLPILIALFSVFQKGLDPARLSFLYSFVNNPGALNPIAFGLLDLSKGNIYLGIAAAIIQYFQIRIMMPPAFPQAAKDDFSRAIQLQTLYVMPAIVLVWSFTLPSALTLYWTISNIFAIVQEIITEHYAK